MSRIIRTPHFRQYCESVYVAAGSMQRAWGEQEAKDKFAESLHDDFSTLAWIIDSIYPGTKRVGNDYLFVSGPISHTHVIRNVTEEVGAFSLRIAEHCEPTFEFENQAFHHGNVYYKPGASHHGRVSCWGSYRHFAHSITTIGFSGALMDMYNFAQHSSHYTVMPVAGQLSD